MATTRHAMMLYTCITFLHFFKCLLNHYNIIFFLILNFVYNQHENSGSNNPASEKNNMECENTIIPTEVIP